MVSKKKQSKTPSGYGLHSVFGGPDAPAELLVPTWLLEQLEVEELERDRLFREEVTRKRAEADAAKRARFEEALDNSPAPPPAPIARNPTPFQAAQALTIPDKLPPTPENSVSVFDWDAARDRFNLLKKHPSAVEREIITRDLQHFAKAMANGPWRSIARPETWRKDLEQLAAEMPNFAPVVALTQRAMALADLSGRPATPQPILLLGAPGVGKTHFTQRLAEVLRTTIHRQPFDNSQSNSALRGSERHWGNSAF